MLNHTFKPQQWLLRQGKATSIILGLLLMLGFTGIAVAESVSVAARLETAPSNLTDGQHVYGSAPEANQVGETYMVFEAEGNRVVGGFYMPSSSFDCFHGRLDENRLALNIQDSYSNEVYPFNLAVSRETLVADGQSAANANIPGFQPLESLSAMDEQVLDTCRGLLSQEI
ncbi:hypothetical protein E1H12_08935 [Geitlerinema sp. P-1104]|uniref:hypothetical protein n=1 Tax=Geitlerinema sp. P-1104 TaxID=2546230 RepID=UPI00147743E0|nr:hypothetical protein [Geitlerinema sp. P-1104]NMG58643.1 hypothetical protein [Geitlerinema sp. P-1104]